MKKVFLIACIFFLILTSVYATEFKAYSAVNNDSFLCFFDTLEYSEIKDSISFYILSRDAIDRENILFYSCPRIFFGDNSEFNFSDKEGFFIIDYSGNTDKDNFFLALFRHVDALESTECILCAMHIIDGELQSFDETEYHYTVQRVIHLLTTILTQKTRIVFTEVETHEKQIIQMEVDEEYALDVLSDLNDFVALIY